MVGHAGVDNHLDEIVASTNGNELYFNSGHCSWDNTNHKCEGAMVKVLTASGIVAWQKKIVASDRTNYQAIYATDVEIQDDLLYFAFMYLGDCLIIVLDTAGNEVMKKQFGVNEERDILGELVFTSSSLYLFG